MGLQFVGEWATLFARALTHEAWALRAHDGENGFVVAPDFGVAFYFVAYFELHDGLRLTGKETAAHPLRHTAVENSQTNCLSVSQL